MTPLLRELILHLATLPSENVNEETTSRLYQVVADQLHSVQTIPFQLPVVSHKRLKPLCDALLQQPQDRRTLEEWSQSVNMSSRSISRLFRQEVGLSFVEYRQQARLLAALKALAKGVSVSAVGLEVGFSSLSAFHHVFKKNFGFTPKHFFQENKS